MAAFSFAAVFLVPCAVSGKGAEKRSPKETTREEEIELERWRSRIHGPTTTNGSSNERGEETTKELER